MKIPFSKYHGAGNDFVLIDDRSGSYQLTTSQIADICNRRTGVGADGLMLLQKSSDYDFRMLYYNSDGRTASMCGNGGRCITAFAKRLGIIDTEARFEAGDDPHTATVVSWDGNSGIIRIGMNVVAQPKPFKDGYFVNTGVPHFVQRVEDIDTFDVYSHGKSLRFSADFAPEGTNVDFWSIANDGRLLVRTYERGVEGETLSCGTGVTATALVIDCIEGKSVYCKELRTLGGEFCVSYKRDSEGNYKDVCLQGPATFVFDGEGDF